MPRPGGLRLSTPGREIGNRSPLHIVHARKMVGQKLKVPPQDGRIARKQLVRLVGREKLVRIVRFESSTRSTSNGVTNYLRFRCYFLSKLQLLRFFMQRLNQGRFMQFFKEGRSKSPVLFAIRAL